MAEKSAMSPNLEAGQEITAIAKITEYTYDNNGEQVKGINLFTSSGEFHTTATAIVEKLTDYFIKEGNTEPLENVRVIARKSKSTGRKYLDIEGF